MKRDLKKYYADYIDQPFEKEQVFYRKKKVLERLNYYKPKRILEVGCGEFSQVISNYKYDSLTIIEPSKEFYNKVSDFILEKNFTNVKIENCYFEDFSSEFFNDFDFILISSLLHEIEALQAFFDKLIEVSSHDCIIHINVPNANSLHRLLGKSMGVIKDTHEKTLNNIKFQTIRIFNAQSLEDTVSKYNFKILHKESFFIKPFTHSQMQAMLDNKIIDNKILEGLFNLSTDDSLGANIGSELIIEFTK